MKTQLPAEYLAYVAAGKTDEAQTDGEPGYFQLWTPDEVGNMNTEYRVPEYAPGFI